MNMTDDIGMFAIDGFDEAIIGTALTPDGSEVLVYNAVLVEIMLKLITDGKKLSITEFLEVLGCDSLGSATPMFVYLDDAIKTEVRENRKPQLRIVH
jgi:hypothetical protein